MKIKQMIVKEGDVDILKNILFLKINCVHFLNERKDCSSIKMLVSLSNNKFPPTSAKFSNNRTNTYCYAYND